MASDQVQSLKRAFELLTLLETAGRPLSLQELSAQSGLPKSTVYRLLSTLASEDVVEQSNLDGHYRLGLRLLELGSSAGSARSVINIAKPYMQQIAFEINESVCLAVLNRGEALILEFNESSSAFHVVSRVGARLPAHCTVQGKIMLAHLAASEVKRILREHGMQVYTPNTIRTYEQLALELEEIRKQGYAVDNSEFHIGLCSIAAPIYDAAGNVGYSFAIVSMFHKIVSPEFNHAKDLVLGVAADISKALGYRGGK
ncbi:MAG: IclR family transcriptional regulator [Clostridia bacterium]